MRASERGFVWVFFVMLFIFCIYGRKISSGALRLHSFLFGLLNGHPSRATTSSLRELDLSFSFFWYCLEIDLCGKNSNEFLFWTKNENELFKLLINVYLYFETFTHMFLDNFWLHGFLDIKQSELAFCIC